MPGGFLKKLGTDSCGITGTLVAVAFVWAASGGGGNTSDAAPASATMASRNEIQRFIRGSLRKMATRPTLASRQTVRGPRNLYDRQAAFKQSIHGKASRYNALQVSRAGRCRPDELVRTYIERRDR